MKKVINGEVENELLIKEVSEKTEAGRQYQFLEVMGINVLAN